MKKKKDQNVCIRIDRDVKQINRCKAHIDEVNNSLVEMSLFLALAGNEVRLKILLLLQKENRLCVCDLSEILEMKIPAISQHLRKMKDAQMVYKEREGTVIYYQISSHLKPTLNTILNLISETALT